MVRELFTRSSTVSLGSVSLSVDELIGILEGKKFEKITARNNDIAFDSIEDMKMNRALLVGAPSVTCEDIWIYFDKFNPSVKIYKFSDENLSLAKSIAAEISQRKSLNDKDNQRYVTVPLWTIVISYYFIQFIVKPAPAYDREMWIFSNASSASNLIILLIYLNSGYINFVRKSVYYRPKEGFLRRNLEKIVVGLIGALLGAGIKILIDRL